MPRGAGGTRGGCIVHTGQSGYKDRGGVSTNYINMGGVAYNNVSKDDPEMNK